MPFVEGQRRERGSLTAAEAAHLGDLLGRLHPALGSCTPGPGAPAAVPSREALAGRWADLRAKAAAAMEIGGPLVRARRAPLPGARGLSPGVGGGPADAVGGRRLAGGAPGPIPG